jgi:phage shock protein C
MVSQWSRAADGILAGVCKGLAKRFAVDVMLVRLLWLFSVLFFGTGILIYIILAIGLPREDKLSSGLEPRFLGVASRFAQRFDLDVGLTRVGFLLFLVMSMGTMMLAYFVFYFILPKSFEQRNSL